ncbi:MAG: hypothetical protein KGL34_06600, partial [Gammaproteobacteria bacterium]|nr:hypothetical protein [Gammaproteobacteria bacterium]
MDQVRVFTRAPIVFALLFAGGALFLGADHALQSGDAPARDPWPHLSTSLTPAGQSIGRWLWPGAFEVSGGGSKPQVTFVASGRRYIAEARSDQLRIRYGANAQGALQIALAGARRDVSAELREEIPGKLYLLDGYRQRARAAWHRYGVVIYHDVWPGIDVRLRANNGDLELDFLVHPGADPGAIELTGQGETHFSVDASSGDIMAVRGGHRFRLHRPRAFQETSTGTSEVDVHVITNRQSLRFALGKFDRARPLLIDPLVATWSTFVGTDTDAMTDNAAALATDSSGNLYVGGTTGLDTQALPSDSFPTTPNSLDPANPRSPGDNCAYG